MEKLNCLYCDQPIEVVHNDKDKKKNNKKPQLLFTCPHCKLSFTRWDIERSQKRQDELDNSLAQASQNEDDCLSDAWRLMQQNEWEAASERLFNYTKSLKHPLGFALYRSITQLGITAKCDDDQLDQRHSALDSMLNNLSVLDDYLPSDNKERFHILTRLSDALLLADKIPIYFLSQKTADDSYIPPIDETCKKRAQLCQKLADYLENIKDRELGTDYLQMAYTLWCDSWEQAKEPKNAVYLTRFDSSMRLSINERRQIKDKIKELEGILSIRIPNFEPKRLSPFPPIVRTWQAILITAGALCAFFLFVWLLSLHNNGAN